MTVSLATVTEHATAATTAAAQRDSTIRAAHAKGASIRAIAAAAGLSPARVHQILHGR
jgi:hypothetical protein